MNPDLLAKRGVKSTGPDIFMIGQSLHKFGYMRIIFITFYFCLSIFSFYDVLFRFYHFRCLNILKFGHLFHFWCRKKIWCILTDMLFFAQYFDHILYRAWSRAGHREHDSKCLNEVYKAYRMNHIIYKQFLVKPNWVKVRQILGGQYCPPPWTWR